MTLFIIPNGFDTFCRCTITIECRHCILSHQFLKIKLCVCDYVGTTIRFELFTQNNIDHVFDKLRGRILRFTAERQSQNDNSIFICHNDEICISMRELTVRCMIDMHFERSSPQEMNCWRMEVDLTNEKFNAINDDIATCFASRFYLLENHNWKLIKVLNYLIFLIS